MTEEKTFSNFSSALSEGCEVEAAPKYGVIHINEICSLVRFPRCLAKVTSHACSKQHFFVVTSCRYLYCSESKRGAVCSEASQIGSYLFQEPEEQKRLPQTQKEHVLALPLSPFCHEGVCLHEGNETKQTLYVNIRECHVQVSGRTGESCGTSIELSPTLFFRHCMIEVFLFPNLWTTTDTL